MLASHSKNNRPTANRPQSTAQRIELRALFSFVRENKLNVPIELNLRFFSIPICVKKIHQITPSTDNRPRLAYLNQKSYFPWGSLKKSGNPYDLNLRNFSPKIGVKKPRRARIKLTLLTSPRFFGRPSACPRFATAKNTCLAPDLGYPPAPLFLQEVVFQKAAPDQAQKPTAQ